MRFVHDLLELLKSRVWNCTHQVLLQHLVALLHRSIVSRLCWQLLRVAWHPAIAHMDHADGLSLLVLLRLNG